MHTIILQADTYHDYHRDEYYNGEFHVISSLDKDKALVDAKFHIDAKCKERYLNNSSENEYDYICGVNGFFVGGDANISYPGLEESQEGYVELMEQEAQTILDELNVYEKERAAYWKEQYNIKVRAAQQLRNEQQRIAEQAELKRLQQKYGK